jgi:hypothetical protein
MRECGAHVSACRGIVVGRGGGVKLGWVGVGARGVPSRQLCCRPGIGDGPAVAELGLLRNDCPVVAPTQTHFIPIGGNNSDNSDLCIRFAGGAIDADGYYFTTLLLLYHARSGIRPHHEGASP